jgi:hypothetical protein
MCVVTGPEAAGCVYAGPMGSKSIVIAAVWACACGGSDGPGPFEGEVGTVMFVTQVPATTSFAVIDSNFSNHSPGVDSAPRGGDLMIRYPDGTLRNLTREAGFGDEAEMQGANAIAVREPTVHWSGNKALFSMVIGSPTERFEPGDNTGWQIYEVSGIARDEAVTIRKISGQPEGFNNVSPIYGSDDKILFASDRPRGGELHLHPQLDEYESQRTTVGIYRLEESSGDLELIEHSPSGVFSLSIDSFGRVIFVKWDHLQRDQQGDSPALAAQYGAITFVDESPMATSTSSIAGAEMFPEPRIGDDPGADPALNRHAFNHFFPWEINQDGSAEETLNHIGRQEWGGTFTEGNFIGDNGLSFEAPDLASAATIKLPDDGGTFHIRQDPVDPNSYLAISAGEFDLGGRIVRFDGAPTINPVDMGLVELTAREDGRFRSPLRLTAGGYVAVRTSAEDNAAYQLVALTESGDRLTVAGTITGGIERTVTWLTPDETETYSGALWELDPVEVAPRPVPPLRERPSLAAPEQAIFDELGVDPAELSTWLRDRELALVVSRNVTQRDRNDVQQPYNLAVPGGVSSTRGSSPVYQVSHLQFVQADLLRGYEDHSRGRRPLARPIHGPDLFTDPSGAVELGIDGSMAALVPARRALSWQLTAPDGTGVVRERNWVSFAAGEIRVCASCHGINKESQTGDPAPENSPAALRSLLQQWQAIQ